MLENEGNEDSQRGGHWRAFKHAMLLCGIYIFCNSVARGSSPQIPFNIPEGDFAETIETFCAQANVYVSYGSSMTESFKGFKGIRTRAVVGAFDPHAALAFLLEGTGLAAEWSSEQFVWVRKIDSGPSTQARIVGGDDQQGSPGSAQPVPEFGLSSAPMDQVLVTGTLIRGVDAITAPLITLVNGQIGETGYVGAQSMIDNTLLFTSNNTPREDYGGVVGNFGSGQGINLRDLGVSATLVLVDGQRQPLSGLNGSFVDVSTVPSAAIDRIEVIPDGASALYGSDAIAGVVNIRLKQDFDGAESSVRYAFGEGGGDETVASQIFGSKWDGGHGMVLYEYTDRTSVPYASRSYAANPDKRPEGGDDFRTVDSNPGNILNPVTFLPSFAIPPGRTGRALSVNQLLPGQVNLQNQWLGRDLYPQRTSHSFYATVDQELSSTIKWFFEARLDRREDRQEDQATAETLTVPASNAFYVDPFGRTPYVSVAYSFFDDLGNAYQSSRTVTATAATGVKVDLTNGWQSTLSVSNGVEDGYVSVYNLVNPKALPVALADSSRVTAFDPFGAGSNTSESTLNQIRDVQGDQALFRVPELSTLTDGPLFSWNDTSAKLAMGLDLRQESLRTHTTLTGYADDRGTYQREIGSVFGELALRVPEHIEVSLAGRYEHYSDFGSTLNPKVGIRWTPWSSAKLRASWGTSFRAPDLPDLVTSKNASGLLVLPDPKSPTGQSVVLYETGNLPHMHEERAATWTLGLDLAPPMIPGLKTSLTYYSIDYQDRIAQPALGSYLSILEEEAVWGEVIQRNPAPATVMAICNGPGFQGTPSNCQSTPPTVIVDYRVRNLSTTIAKGIDLNIEQPFDNALGFFRWSAQEAYILTFGQAVTDSAPVTSVANTVGNPIKVKARATLSWSQRRAALSGLSIQLAENFQGSYLDNQSMPNRRIASYSTADAQVGYVSGEGDRWFENLRISLGATNVFNRNPPFVNSQYGYDQANTPPLGRLFAISLKKNW